MVPYVYASIGIDPSWTQSLAMAFDQNLIFGKDFVFNYGPLGFLNTLLLPASVSPFFILIFHIFLLINYLYIIAKVIRLGQKPSVVLLFALATLLPWGGFADTSFTLFYLLVFWLLEVYYTRKIFGLAISILLVLLIFFIKVNLSIIAIGVFALFTSWLWVKKVISPIIWLSSLLVLVISMWGLSFPFHVAIPSYLSTSLEIIDAYQDAQAAVTLGKKELYILLFFDVLLLAPLLGVFLKDLRNLGTNLATYLVAGLALFLSFKQAYTAVGHFNAYGFYLFTPMVMLLFYMFFKEKEIYRKAFIAVFVIHLLATQFVRLGINRFSFKSYLTYALPASSGANPTFGSVLQGIYSKSPHQYFAKIASYDHEQNFQNKDIMLSRQLPDSVLTLIGESSVDLMPWELSYVYFNRLHYSPRPVIQSYQANSAALTRINQQKYASKTGPEFVLATLNEYREQNPGWIDPGAIIALHKNYELRQELDLPEEKYLLLKKLRSVSPKENVQIAGEGELNELIKVPTAENLWLKADISYSNWGKLARLFYQPPYLRCTLYYEDGQSSDFRIPPPILAGGVPISEELTTHEQLKRYFLHLPNRKIKSVKFWAKQSAGFKGDFAFTFYQLN